MNMYKYVFNDVKLLYYISLHIKLFAPNLAYAPPYAPHYAPPYTLNPLKFL
jgi:hypothetical protein